jgi:hypothetical protein
VPGHQCACPAGELGVVGGPGAGDEHRSGERSLVAVDLIDERLGLRRIEQHVVLDERALDVVLHPCAGIADALVPVGDRRCGVGPLRQVAQRVLDELVGPQLLLGADAGYAGEVDADRGIPLARPTGSSNRVGRGVVRVGDGVAGDRVDGGVVRVGDGVAGDRVDGGCLIVSVCGRVGVRMHMGASGEHRRHRERRDQQRRHGEARGVGCSPTHQAGAERSADGHGAQQGARGVGELRCLADLETGDPRDAGEPSGEPAADCARVDRRDRPSGQASRSQQGPEADAQLRNRHHHERLGVRVNAGGGGMDGAGAQ